MTPEEKTRVARALALACRDILDAFVADPTSLLCEGCRDLADVTGIENLRIAILLSDEAVDSVSIASERAPADAERKFMCELLCERLLDIIATSEASSERAKLASAARKSVSS